MLRKSPISSLVGLFCVYSIWGQSQTKLTLKHDTKKSASGWIKGNDNSVGDRYLTIVPVWFNVP